MDKSKPITIKELAVNPLIRWAAWGAFWLTALFGLMSDPLHWDRDQEYNVTLTFGAIGLCLGLAVLIMSGWTRRSKLAVALGILIGQYVFIEIFMIMVLFYIWGFAPFGGFAP